MRIEQLPIKLVAVWWASLELVRAARALRRSSLERWLETNGAEPLALEEWSAAAQKCRWQPTLHGAVERAARLWPESGRCLIKSGALARMRRVAGMGSVLLIGFRRSPDGRLLGHAWLAYAALPDKISGGADVQIHTVTAAYRIVVK